MGGRGGEGQERARYEWEGGKRGCKAGEAGGCYYDVSMHVVARSGPGAEDESHLRPDRTAVHLPGGSKPNQKL